MKSIFISYRRGDSEGESGRIFDELSDQFGERCVFMDVAGIAPGRDFRRAIDESVAACGALLAVIGPTWATAAHPNGDRRLDDPADFVRLEIAKALQRDVPVIPVLVRGAKMPDLEHLPADLADLAYRNAVEISHARFREDIGILVRALREIVPEPLAPAPAATPTAPQPMLDAEVVRKTASELARYIGPIAEVVVRRAARKSASVQDLYETVSTEIEKAKDREAFLASRPR